MENKVYCLDIETAKHCRHCCSAINDGLLKTIEGQIVIAALGSSEMQKDTDELVDYLSAMIDSGVDTVTIPEELRETYDKLYALTMNLTFMALIKK